MGVNTGFIFRKPEPRGPWREPGGDTEGSWALHRASVREAEAGSWGQTGKHGGALSTSSLCPEQAGLRGWRMTAGHRLRDGTLAFRPGEK